MGPYERGTIMDELRQIRLAAERIAKALETIAKKQR